jgi:DNA-binding CsgD family transcriptional regulator
LINLGLSADEEDLYERLVSCGPLSAAELAAEHGEASLSVADGLVARGLMVRRGDRYALVPPDVALQPAYLHQAAAAADLRQKLAVMAVRRTNLAVRRRRGDLVEFVYGVRAMTRIWTALQRVAKSEVRGWDRPPYLGEPLEPPQPHWRINQAERGMVYRGVYDRRAVDIPGRLAQLVEFASYDGEGVRVGDAPLKMVMIDESMAMLAIAAADRIACVVVIREPALLALLAELFESCWARAVPLTASTADPAPAAAGPEAPAPPTEAEREVLNRLVSGYTTAEIATHLGWSDRTVRDHIERMKSRLGAVTRYEAGYLAVRAGWLSPDTGKS